MSLPRISRRRAAAAAVQPSDGIQRDLLLSMLAALAFFGALVHFQIQLPKPLLYGGAAIAALAMLLVGMRRADLPLYVTVVYLPFSKILTGDFGGIMTALNLTNLLLLAIFISWAANPKAEGRVQMEPHPLHLPIILFLLWGIWVYIQRGYRSESGYFLRYLPVLKRWLDPIFLYFLFFHLVKTKQRWKTIVILIMVGVGIAAGMAVHDYMGQRQGSSLERMRIGGIAEQPNILGAFFVYYMFLYTGFWLENIKKAKYWWLLMPFLLCFRGIMVTFSRGAYLAFALGALGLAFFKRKALFFLAIGVMVFAVLNPWMLPGGIRYRMDSTFKNRGNPAELTDAYGAHNLEQELESSAAVRLIVWRGARAMIEEHPFVGVGLGRFARESMKYMPVGKHYDAHNAYLITAAEMGLPALALFIIVLIAIFRVTAVVRYRTSDPFIRATALGFLGGLSGLLLANVFGSRMNTSEVSGYFWILVALMARAYAWVREEQRAARPVRARSWQAAEGRSTRRRLT